MRLGKTAVAAVLMALVLGGAGAEGERTVSRFVLSGTDPEGEAGRLQFLRMAVEPELARSQPLRFSLLAGRFSLEGAASVPYRLEKVTLIERRAGLGLYELRATLSGKAPPRPKRKIEVGFRLEELLGFQGAIQPSQRAIELAARKLGAKSGLAWLIEIERRRDGSIKAHVGFDLP